MTGSDSFYHVATLHKVSRSISDDFCQIVTEDDTWAARESRPFQALSDNEQDFILFRNRVLWDSAQFWHEYRFILRWGSKPGIR